jgi:hypothetical protein
MVKVKPNSENYLKRLPNRPSTHIIKAQNKLFSGCGLQGIEKTMSFTPNEIELMEEIADRVENDIHKALYKPLEVCKKELLPWACFLTTAKSLIGIDRVLDFLNCRGEPALAERIEKAYHELLIFATASDQRCDFDSIEVSKSAESTLKACKDLLEKAEKQNRFNAAKIEMCKNLESQSKLFASKLKHIAEVKKQAGKGQNDDADKLTEDGLTKAPRAAYATYEYAITKNIDLANATDDEVYQWLKSKKAEEDSELTDYELQDCESWKRQLRIARKFHGTQKHKSRAGRNSNAQDVKKDPDLLKQISNQYNKPD